MRNVQFILLMCLIGCKPNPDRIVPNYHPFSLSVIQIKIINKPWETLSIEAKFNTNIPREGIESKTLILDSIGIYYLLLKIDRPASCQLLINDEIYTLFIEPNDTLSIVPTWENSNWELQFSGKGEKFNFYYSEKKKMLGYADIRIPLNQILNSKSKFNLIKSLTDSIIAVELLFLEKNKHKYNFPNWFEDYEYSEIIYSGVDFKTAVPNYNKLSGLFIDSLPKSYYDYLDWVKINNKKAILSSKYFWFLDNYFIRNAPDGLDKLSGFSRSQRLHSYILSKSKKELTGDVKEIYNKYNFSDLIRYFSNNSEIDSLAHVFEVGNYKELRSIAGTLSKNGKASINLHFGDTIPEFFTVNSIDSLISIRDFENKIIYINFWATWCAPCINNISDLNDLISEFEYDQRITFINICIESQKEKWLHSIVANDLHGVNLFAEGNWNSILRSIFDIKGIPQYVILSQNNTLFANFSEKAPFVKERINDALLNYSMDIKREDSN